ncbi:MAG: TnsA endonuclease N-terminal domain-containing protein, partial [Glaciecola sp.]
MSKYTMTEAKIAKRIKEGRGTGSLKSYQPWIYVHELASRGRSQKLYSHLTSRIHHVFSDLEFAVFLLLDFNPQVTDIREQFPLNREDTLDIAREHKLWHPTDKSINLVMSSDFLVDIRHSPEPKFVLQVKYSNELEDARVFEKLEIERRYWQRKGIPWKLITELQIDPIVKTNVDWLYGVKGWHDEEYSDSLWQRSINLSHFFAQHPNDKVIELCKTYDAAYELDLGQTLLEIRSMCVTRLVLFDIRKPFLKLS